MGGMKIPLLTGYGTLPQCILNLLIEQVEDGNNYNDMKSHYFDDSDVSEAMKEQLHELF